MVYENKLLKCMETLGTMEKEAAALNCGSVVFSCGCHENVGVGVTCDHPWVSSQDTNMLPSAHLHKRVTSGRVSALQRAYCEVTANSASAIACIVALAWTVRGIKEGDLEGDGAFKYYIIIV